jgi:drug/metabolite transporter (DMT)-like permease
MGYLLFVSLLWAFSFGLIGTTLQGIDSNLIAFARLALSFLVFLPFLRWRVVRPALRARLVLVGAIQFGIMYATYIRSYRFLDSHQVAMYTILTPIYVALIHDAFERRVRPAVLMTAALAVAGTWIVVQGDFQRIEARQGFLLVQASNLCFAFGQIAYRRSLRRHPGIRDRDVFALLYLGAVLVTGAAAATTADAADLALDARQVLVLVYLGIIASGLGFFLWNLGARRARAGGLAIVNNLKIPLAVACSLIVFGEERDIPSLVLGGGIILGALGLQEWMDARRRGRSPGARA